MNKMPFAENFSDKERKKFRMFATCSALTGCISEWVLDSNTIIILYLVMLGGSESFSMFSSAITGLVSLMLAIPFAGITNKIGMRPAYKTAVYVAMFAYMMMALAPVAGVFAKYLVIAGVFLYSFTRPLYGAAWYPICDAFLLKKERGSFFGTMRFTYMSLNALLLFGAGCLMGANPPLWTMQLVIGFAGIMMFGRKICMDRLPVNPASEKTAYDMKKAIAISIRNAPLMGFGFYVCMVNMSIAAAIPLAVLYMKMVLNFTAFQIMTTTSIGLGGYIAGNAMVGFLMGKFGTKKFQLLMHGICIVLLMSLTLFFPDSKWQLPRMMVLFFLNGVGASFLLCLTSTEMLALAKPTNKLMATSFISTFQNLGVCIGRLGMTVILGLGVLMEQWTFCGKVLSKFNFLFAVNCFMIIFSLLFLLLSPSVVPRHKDYYEPSN